MNSIHVYTYETFPKHKHLKENSGPVIYTNGNPAQNGHLPNGHPVNSIQDDSLFGTGDIITDVNKNRLTATKSEPISSKHESEVVYASVVKQRNTPVLLGPATEANDTNLNKEPSEAIKINRNLQKSNRVEMTLLDKENIHPVTNETSQSDIMEKNSDNDSKKIDQHYKFLDDSDINIVIEEKTAENVYDTVNEQLAQNTETSGKCELLGYQNKAFECSDVTVDSREGVKQQVKRNPLQHQDSVDLDTRPNTEINVINEIIARIPDKEKKLSATEIKTEAMVHVNENGDVGSSALKHSQSFGKNAECQSIEQADDDWPSIDSLVRNEDVPHPVTVETHHERSVHFSVETYRHARSVSDIVQTDGSGSAIEIMHDTKVSEKSTTYSKKTKKQNSSKTVSHSSNGSTRTLKSILTNSCSASQCSHSESYSHRHSDSESEIHELKSVKFAKDTVFNENKTNKYKQEKVNRINLREIYHGKIFSESAMAKMNPLYTDDDGNVEGDGKQGSMTDDEKLAYQISLKKALKMSRTKVRAGFYLRHVKWNVQHLKVYSCCYRQWL